MAAIPDILANLTGYIEAKFDLIKLETKQQVLKIGVSLGLAVLVFFLAFLTILCVTIAAGLWLGMIMGSFIQSFLVLAAFYILLATIAWANRATITRALSANFLD
jgi:hypothetical protein